MQKNQNIAIIILAAGSSSRMNEHVKQILPWKQTTLLGNAIAQANAVKYADVYVVLGAHKEIIQRNMQLEKTSIIFNENWKDGIGSSIASGVNHFSTYKINYDAVLVSLADQPLVDTNYLNLLLTKWQSNRNKIIATKYANHAGVPAIFNKNYFSTLQTLNKDIGAKEIISANLKKLMVINPNGKEIDIDLWETYQKMLQKK